MVKRVKFFIGHVQLATSPQCVLGSYILHMEMMLWEPFDPLPGARLCRGSARLCRVCAASVLRQSCVTARHRRVNARRCSVTVAVLHIDAAASEMFPLLGESTTQNIETLWLHN
jgi:hypothetical protein